MAKSHVSATGIYTSGDGFTKTAVVTATRASSGKRLEKGTVDITVFSPTGKTYERKGVQIASEPTTGQFFPVPVLGPVTLGVKSEG